MYLIDLNVLPRGRPGLGRDHDWLSAAFSRPLLPLGALRVLLKSMGQRPPIHWAAGKSQFSHLLNGDKNIVSQGENSMAACTCCVLGCS